MQIIGGQFFIVGGSFLLVNFCCLKKVAHASLGSQRGA